MKLPSVYANSIDKKIDNNIDSFRSSIDKKIDLFELKSLFDKNGFGDRIAVEINTGDGFRLEKLVLCKYTYFVTIDNRKIYFKDIIDYKIKK